VKITEFTFKTSNRMGRNIVIRKRFANIDDPIGKEVTISSPLLILHCEAKNGTVLFLP